MSPEYNSCHSLLLYRVDAALWGPLPHLYRGWVSTLAESGRDIQLDPCHMAGSMHGRAKKTLANCAMKLDGCSCKFLASNVLYHWHRHRDSVLSTQRSALKPQQSSHHGYGSGQDAPPNRELRGSCKKTSSILPLFGSSSWMFRNLRIFSGSIMYP